MQSTTTPDLTARVLAGDLGAPRAQAPRHEPTPRTVVLKTNAKGEPSFVQHVCTQCERLVARVGGVNKHV